MKRLTLAAAAFAAVTVFGMGPVAQAGATLDAIRQNDTIRCGVNTGLAGFGIADEQGRWTGLDVDYCRGLAAAVLGDADKVEYVPLSAQQRFTALQSGEVDVLSRNTTWTLTRDASLGLVFAGIWFYDGQGFMVPKSLGVTSAMDLDGASVCVQPGTTTELNLADFFRANNMDFEPVVIEAQSEVVAAYFSGRCDVFTTDASGLAATRANEAPNPADHVILPELISKEPLGPVVRRGDDEFFAISKWVLYALVEAEEKGVTAANAAEMKANSTDPTVQRLLGASGDMGEKVGLDPEWAMRAITAVGNYGEIFERHVGVNTPIGLERGVNAQWTEGGLMYAPPLR
ncbi:MAG: amino acid ABC transporter substrate-binding protein [Pseudomonadota bacterium]